MKTLEQCDNEEMLLILRTSSHSTKQRLIIVYARSENVFVPNSLLMLISGVKTGEYHDGY